MNRTQRVKRWSRSHHRDHSKYIKHGVCTVNKFIEKNRYRYISHMGPVGTWDQETVDRLVLPTAGDILVQEEDELVDDVSVNTIVNDLINEIN